jgi:hypothetical protein
MSIRIRVYPQSTSPVVRARRRARKAHQRALRAQRQYQRYLVRQQMLQQTLACARPSWRSMTPPPPPGSGYANAFSGALQYQFQSPWQTPYRSAWRDSFAFQSPINAWAAPRHNGFWGSFGRFIGC